MTARRPRERGSLTLEFAIIAPAVLVLIGLAIVGGRVVVAGDAVDQAAAAAAREASLARDPVTADRQAHRTATQMLDQDLDCRDVTVDLDLSAFARPVGSPGAVRATVTCLVDLQGLGVPGVPGERRLEGTAVSSLDRYRSR